MVPFVIYSSQMVKKYLTKLVIIFVSVFWDIIMNNLLLVYVGCYHMTGLVHISEVSWDLVQDVRDVLTEGEVVKVKVISVDWYIV